MCGPDETLRWVTLCQIGDNSGGQYSGVFNYGSCGYAFYICARLLTSDLVFVRTVSLHPGTGEPKNSRGTPSEVSVTIDQ